MTGAESLLRTFASAGIELCFANPGTTELALVSALDAVPELRPVPTLFEGVCSGAADGYARLRGRPALTLLHHGAGLTNALANLHNARRARSPVINLVGDHTADHAAAEPPLAADVATLATPISGWVRTATSATSLAADGAAALVAAQRPPGRVATLVIPGPCAWQEGGAPVLVGAEAEPDPPSPSKVTATAKALRGDEPAALLLDGAGLRDDGLAAAARVAAASGAALLCPTFPARIARGDGRPSVERLPYFPEAARNRLDLRHLILAGAETPVAFFTYPGDTAAGRGRGELLPEGCTVYRLAAPGDDVVAALEALADELGAASWEAPALRSPAQERVNGEAALTPPAVAAAVASALPGGTVVVDDASTGSQVIWAGTATAAPHEWLCLTGGALGQGLPLAVGASLAAPARPVLCLVADGAAMYSPQALWTLAREELAVTVVVLANRRYRILEIEMQRLGLEPSAAGQRLFDHRSPAVDWAGLAKSLGVEATRATTFDGLRSALLRGFRRAGPVFIEAVLEDR